MFRFIAIRILQFPLILAIIYLITFMLVWVAPGDPFQRTERKVPEAVKKVRREQMHATHWTTFLGYYPLRMIRGDLGPSMTYDAWPVSTIISEALPVSFTIGLLAMVVATLAGVAIGTMAAVWRDGIFDWFSLTLALVGISLPGFVTAALLFALFSVEIRIFPVGGDGSIDKLILPALALSLAPMAYIARLMRVATIDVLSNDYIRTARAKGLSNSKVVWKHALRNAFLPVLSFLGPAAAATLTGSFVVEKVFNLPGLGTHFVNSIQNRDQTLILGTVMIYSVFLLSLNLLVDIGYAFVDPRIDMTARQNSKA